MRVVKALVAFMGILIVVGIGLVVYGLSLEKNAPDTSVEQNTPTVTPSVPFAGGDNAAAQSALGAFGDVVIDLEEGERLVGYSVDGPQATLHIEGRHGDSARLVIVSLSEKKVLGRILLQQDAQ
ncbi:hypothetical protein [Thalassospira tepidiphila]|nr:hypothetical protein [Thalassospira tepidiphila]NJB75152.1 hypothetical protein [Thalassospira tepidiphila]